MSAVAPQDIDWIQHAPVRARGEAISTAPPNAVFDVLRDHEGFVEWFPGVKAVDVIGPREGVGARRRVKIPLLTVDERFIVWEPGARWSFTATAASPRWTRSLVEDCVLRPHDGGTHVSYTMYFDPVGVVGFLMRHSVKRISRSLQKAMENLAVRAAR